MDTLWDNANYFKAELKRIGYDIGKSETPITPVVGDEKLAQEFSKNYWKRHMKPIVYPTVPLGTGRVRNMPNAGHTKEMLDDAIKVYEKLERTRHYQRNRSIKIKFTINRGSHIHEKVLITGALGQIGSELTERLRNDLGVKMLSQQIFVQLKAVLLLKMDSLKN